MMTKAIKLGEVVDAIDVYENPELFTFCKVLEKLNLGAWLYIGRIGENND